MKLLCAAGLLLVIGCKKDEPVPVAPASATASAAAPVVVKDAGCASCEFEKAKVPGASLATIDAAGNVTVQSFGLADVEASRKVDEETVFDVASLGKVVVVMSVIMLVHEGSLRLDEDVRTILPQVKNPTYPDVVITVESLLRHTSSIKDDSSIAKPLDGGAPNLSAFVDAYFAPKVVKSHFGVAPGTWFEYSNAAYAVAALIVERKSKVSFADFTRDKVFVPAKMTSATWRPSTSPNVARPYKRDGSAFVLLPSNEYAVFPAVGLHATAKDMGRLLAMLVKMDADIRPLLQNVDRNKRALVGHEGEMPGAASLFFFDEKTKKGGVVLTNGDAFTSNDQTRTEAINGMLDLAF